MKDYLSVTPKQGKNVLDEAVKRYQEQQSEKVLAQVSAVMERISVLTQLEKKTEKRLAFCRKQLQAIEKGDFSLDQFTNQIKFNDEELNLDWSYTERW